MHKWIMALAAAGQLGVSGSLHAQAGGMDDPGPPAAAGPADPLAAPEVRVETLREALARTYQTSPTLMAQRAGLRAVDNTAALARADGRPQLTTILGFDQDIYRSNTIGANGRSFSAAAEVSLPLFSGGQVRNAVKAADTRVEAGRADLRATEGDAFTEAVSAYVSVIRDRQILGFNEDQVRVLEANLEAARSRFKVGDLTQTDVAQSEARLALARSSLAAAQGRLEGAEQNFLRVIGAPAGDLQVPPPPPELPGTPDAAVEIALAENADLAAIAARTKAAGHDVAVARGQRLPTLSAVGATGYSNALGRADEAAGLPEGTLPNTSTNVSAGLSMRLPLYQGGGASAQVRRAEDLRMQLLEQSIGFERLVIARARAAFATYHSALAAITSNEAAVAANELALESVRVEQTVGARSVLDVLNAEQELLSSRVALASAKRDAYVAAFTLLNAMGQVEAEDLNLQSGPLYDPETHYRRYARDWFDWNDGAAIYRKPVSTRTAPPDADSPVTTQLERTRR